LLGLCWRFVLAETGLLAGRSATTHWTYLDELTRRFPDIRVDGDKAHH
jgi:transcriptional regulator GlxA family with amidase domain